MNTRIFKAEERGHADHGWLKANHYFSFAGWYDANKIHFGALRVVNDDHVAAGRGFGTHPHDNMEIITIPTIGELQHKDSMGNGSIIKPGEVQVMSAGTGIQHSEFNPSKINPTELFQIWIYPKEKNISPVYNQAEFDPKSMRNTILPVVGPNGGNVELQINQDAWISMTLADSGTKIQYKLRKTGNGVFTLLVSGKSKIEDYQIIRRDAIGITDTNAFDIDIVDDSYLIFIEIPMQF